MFTPFVQYSIDQASSSAAMTVSGVHEVAEKRERAGQNVFGIGEVIGCLERSPAGNWLLTNANAPTLSETQATTSVALKTAHQHEKVAVKGIVIRDSKGARINLTSLQMLASTCGK